MTYSKDHEFDERPGPAVPGVLQHRATRREASAFAKASVALGSATLFGDLQVRTAEFRYRPTDGYGLEDVSQRWNFVNPKVGRHVRGRRARLTLRVVRHDGARADARRPLRRRRRRHA